MNKETLKNKIIFNFNTFLEESYLSKIPYDEMVVSLDDMKDLRDEIIKLLD